MHFRDRQSVVMKRLKIQYIAFVILLGLFFSCKKDDFTPPAVQTLSVTASSPTSFNVVGSISKVGSEKVEDYGFVYNNTQEIDENKGVKVSLGKDVKEGEFQKQIRVDSALAYSYNNTIWVRSYLRDSKGTVFGAMLNVSLPRPSMGNIAPNMAMSGEVVKITGTFFDATVNNTTVMFENIKAKLVSVGETEISAEVPAGIQRSHGQEINVSVRIGSTPAGSGSFRILANFKDFMPKSGPVGTKVAFTGDNLPDSYYGSEFKVNFGDQTRDAYYYNGGIDIPFTVKENFDLSITVAGKNKMLGAFKVTPPVITSIEPSSLFPGQTLQIKGTNFPPSEDYYGNVIGAKVRLGSAAYQNVSYYPLGQFNYTVPENTAPGEYTIKLNVGPNEVSAPQNVKVLAFAATSFSPKSGSPLQQLNISGSFIAGNWYNVYVGSVVTSATAASSTSLQVPIPYGVNIGKTKISVEFPDKRVTIPGDFEVIGPSFSSFSPASAVPGTILTIKGAGFISDYGTVVKFGSIVVNPNSISDNTIVVTVPSNVTPGAMKLTVVTGGQTVVHKDNFTLLDK